MGVRVSAVKAFISSDEKVRAEAQASHFGKGEQRSRRNHATGKNAEPRGRKGREREKQRKKAEEEEEEERKGEKRGGERRSEIHGDRRGRKGARK